jgi:hypothetical protein
MKKLIALSAVAAMAATGAMADQAADIAKLQKEVKKLKKSLSKVKAQAGGDNIKWDVDFRTAVDMIDYETVAGNEVGNDALVSNRLWLGMGYAPSENMIFKGQLSMQKAWGAAAPNQAGPTAGFPQRGYGYDAFDWVQNENLSDGTLRVREAYWLYKNESLFGSDVSWTASLGRRPATGGFLANLRDDDKAKSPLGHVINMEFDGGSFKLGLDKVTGVDGMYFKLCFGRGLTNAGGRFQQTGLDYTRTDSDVDNTDMAGFIFVPYDDGQYSVQTTYYRGFNVPGLYAPLVDGAAMPIDPTTYLFASVGDMDGAAASFMANGVGDGINDFLDETILFASFAYSRTNPDLSVKYNAQNLGGMGIPDGQYSVGMLGSTDKEDGHSIWLGAQIPAMFTEDGRIGIEYNKGSEYWRPFTYGEDTMAGSKLATRGEAYEIYYTQPLMEGFSFQLRATQMEYDYAGSQGFFANGGQPWDLNSAADMGRYSMMTGGDPVKEARDIRAYLRYRY